MKRYECPRATGPVPQDGRLDHAVWQTAPWTDDFVDIEGDAKPAPRFRTRVKMLWDDEHFYVAAEMEEPHVWATLTEHDSVIFQDNDFEVFIDPDSDTEQYFEFEINALNTTWDLYLPKRYSHGGSADNGWEAYAQTSVHVNGTLNDPSDEDQGWSCVIAFPWANFGEAAGMPLPPRTGDVWRVNFSRVEWDVTIENGLYVKVPNRPEHNWVWCPQHQIDMHQPEHWGFVEFVGE